MTISIHPDQKMYHMANKFNRNGGVSALCFKTLRSINLNKSLWTTDPSAVTCGKCIKIMESGDDD